MTQENDKKKASAEEAQRSTRPSIAKKKAQEGGVDPHRIPSGSSWDGAWKIAAAVGAVGLLLSAFGYAGNGKRFAFSYLFGFEVILTVALGSIFFVLMQHLTSAGWSITVRRISEFFAVGAVSLIVLFAPVWLLKEQIFPWLGHHGEHGAETSTTHTTGADLDEHAAQAEHGAEPAQGAHGSSTHTGAGTGAGDGHGAGNGHGAGAHGAAIGAHGGAAFPQGDPHELAEEKVLEAKKPYLNSGFFSLRAIVYLLVWAFLGWKLFRYSVDQDTTKDPKLTVGVQRFAPIATILFALTLTFAGFDWIMSLDPSWFSTIFGVYCFAGSVLAGLTTLILTTQALRRSGLLRKEINTEHYHDLGKLTFGFLVFWAYIGFSQFMLIWYAALPEETTFFHHRWDHGPWSGVSLLLVFAHFVFPFFLLLSRNTKRKLQLMTFGAAWVLLMHVIDIYWLVMPNVGQDDFAFHWLDVTCLLGIGGVYLAVVFYVMRKHRLIPVGDPRLLRAIHFENA
ncbi:hypothetical protein [Pendulispora albinea]|uniref:Quinol:cytochrome C oxidoreductase n=1 Tax=Pendulispora albinea TaxID=2741071 RepID=A0ABZ2LRY1_9BACT